MKPANLITGLLLGAVVSVSAATYTDKNAFLAALMPGYYYNDLSSLTPGNASPLTTLPFTGGSPSVSYQITANPSGLFVNNDAGFNAVGNWAQSDDLVLTLTSSNVYALGAEFYLTDINGVRQNGTIALTFSDGTLANVPVADTGSYGFFGVITTPTLSSLILTHNPAGFLNMAKPYSGATPEPATTGLILAGLAGLLYARRRN